MAMTDKGVVKMMNTEFLRGICVGAVAGVAAELLMMNYNKSSKTRAGNTMRAMGNAVDDVVDNISHTFH